MSEADIENLATNFDQNKGLLFLGARLPRDQVLVLGRDIIDTVHEIFQYLIPVYRFIAWSPDNDAISMEKLVAERNQALKASHEALEKEKAERGAKRREQEILGLKLRAEIEDRVRKTDSWRQREIAARRTAAVRAASPTKSSDARAQAEALAAKMGLGSAKTAKPEPTPKTPAPNKPQKPRHQTQRGPKQHKRPDPNRPSENTPLNLPTVPKERAAQIQTGDVVEVKKGFLRGRRGQVQEIDEKGGLRVSFGALSSRLMREDVSGLGPQPIDQHPKRTGYKKGNNEFKSHRPRFRGKLSRIEKNSKESQHKKETRESSRSREGK